MTHHRLWNILAGIAAITTLSIPCASALQPASKNSQIKGYEIKNINLETAKTPRENKSLRGPKEGNPTFDDWVVIDVEFDLEETPKKADEEWLDEITVRIHVLTPKPTNIMLDKDRLLPEEPFVYTIEQKYGPVKKGRGLATVAFISPNITERYIGQGADSKLQQQGNIAVEILVRGQVACDAELNIRKGDEDWFTRGGKTGYLLPIGKTPWAMSYWTRYLPPLERRE